jgi:prepilin-type N-terminal cleavage/methylation domain-containing protein
MTATRPPAPAGFSLIEMMVVVAVVSVLAVSAGLALSTPRGSPAAEARALERAAAEAAVRAVLADTPSALRLSPDGWVAETAPTPGAWSEVPGSRHSLAAGRIALPDPAAPTRLVALPDGRLSELRVTIVSGDAAEVCAVAGGRLSCSAP